MWLKEETESGRIFTRRAMFNFILTTQNSPALQDHVYRAKHKSLTSLLFGSPYQSKSGRDKTHHPGADDGPAGYRLAKH
jgi:hypothetical protein